MATDTPVLPDASASLMLAIVITSTMPIILLDRELRIVAASTSFCSAFDVDAAAIPGHLQSELGGGEWDVPQLISGLISAISGNSSINGYEMHLKREGHDHRDLVLEAHRLEYGKDEDVRIMLSVADVTGAKAAEKLKDDLLRDKAMLLQELQHRVANSLQIIASVLMQSAKTSMSDETRGHLNDAHDRVMSVASLQRQLAVSKAGEVDLRTYFNDLCRSIGASMIRDRTRTKIEVTCDDSVTTAETSVSLGLIVTELVINCLKHAFPHDRKGEITVDYRSSGADWTLTICDDGVGMPDEGEDSKPGLGTSIVEALAKQLGALIVVTNARPGTHVAIEYIDIFDISVPRLALAGR
ncbi:ATP-binding protein [Devosia sp. XJ19-1]|uniref:sensor histidine kinase n=1 Tax=Devosia ureilytica TaxID=2952754 RepID=UPI0020C76B63|nr:histidine kinase dimerization/phosphoacceptor domain -containing protein [Devosia ureilytica]MCP8885395.1 ATP-binding protein [Devosia ureilytica]